MLVAGLLLRGMSYAMAFFIGNFSVSITIYCQNGERGMTYYCQETIAADNYLYRRKYKHGYTGYCKK